MAELVSSAHPKRWNIAKGAKGAAIFGIATYPLDLLMYHHDPIGGVIRMCQAGGSACADQVAGELGHPVGWMCGPIFLVVIVCSVRNLLVLRRL